jgi:low molecular weight phosphotyrosine protein phosphatase
VKKSDFNEFDYIFGMDDDNMDDLNSLAPSGSKAKLELLGTYDPEGERIIRDPYYVSHTIF